MSSSRLPPPLPPPPPIFGGAGPLMGKLTADLVLRSPQYMNCLGDYELDLRGEEKFLVLVFLFFFVVPSTIQCLLLLF